MTANNEMDKNKLKKKQAIDREKAKMNARKAKEKEKRLKKQMKEEKARIRMEKKKGSILEEAVTVEESVTVSEDGNVERTITIEESYTIEEKAGSEADNRDNETKHSSKIRQNDGVKRNDANKQNDEVKQSDENIQGNRDKQSKEQDKKKMPILGKRLVIICVTIVILIAAGLGSYIVVNKNIAKQRAEDAAVEAMIYTEATNLSEYSNTQHKKDRLKQSAGKDSTQSLVDAAKYMLDGIKNRPPEIEITPENAREFAKIQSCEINPETGKIDINVTADGLAISDDGYYYLFAMRTYDTAIYGDEYIIEEEKDTDMTFSINLNYNTVNSRLFSKFVMAIKKDGVFVEVCEPHYITNPEAIAKYKPSFGNTNSKKGLLVDPEKLKGNELDDLGVKHAAYNIPLSRILGNTTNEYYPTVYYSYDGRNYAFNGQVIAEYDYIFSTLSSKGITTTAIILNDMNPYFMELIHPKARDGGGKSLYYAFNATDIAGTEYIAAVGSFLASRYAGNGHGTVMNWVIGNEINARNEWNYISYMDAASYTKEYADAFRVFYNAILSINGNARVYISLDQQWGKSLYSSKGYGSKEILDHFNSYLKYYGNIDWGVAYHPYNYPLTNPKAWSSSGKAGSYVLNSETTPVISIKNIHVLTDYLQREDYLTDDGQVRPVVLSEMGYTSSSGQDLQAASFVYAYKIIEANRHIDSILLTRETDAAIEVAQGLALGINTQDGGRKSIYNAYKYIDTPESAKYTDFALGIIGISNWSEVISQH